MPKNTPVLVVEDDPRIRKLIKNVMEQDGFPVFEAQSHAEAIRQIKSRQPCLVTLDLQLGADDGIDIARDIRGFSQVPIIMVTGKGDVIDRVVGLEIGADDYITKPFHVREFMARVRSVLRRHDLAPSWTAETPREARPARVLVFDGLRVRPDRMELFDRDGRLCDLTSGDFKLLSVLMSHPHRALSRDWLMDRIGGIEWTPMDRTIDNQVARLRKKIESDPARPRLIKTVRGVGYLFACDVQERVP